MKKQMALGPLMLDLKGIELDDVEREMLRHPLTGGVILFARNYESPQQLRALTTSIRGLRDPGLLIAVDHEGGRVQRFVDGFTVIPPMSTLGRLWPEQARAKRLARAAGTVIAYELAGHGIDFSFTPVLDIDFGSSGVIGDRAFSSDPDVVAELAGQLVAGLTDCGMAAVGKHFPGHGFVRADSHLAVPRDERSWEEIERHDLLPFKKLIAAGLKGIMPAHVIYPSMDEHPAGFSGFWLRKVLRDMLDFNGLIFSDDLSMEGASTAGDILARARAAFSAGCDMALVCNAPEAAADLLGRLEPIGLLQSRANAMRADFTEKRMPRYQDALGLLAGRST